MPRPHTNFGGEPSLRPRQIHVPADDKEVLALLDRHRDAGIRVFGALHSWSGAAEAPDVALDLRRLDAIELVAGDPPQVRVGGGCRIGRLLRRLRSVGLTLPTLGASTRLSVAGALATGTHGSGAPGLSHFVLAVRVAAYDPDTGRARLYEWHTGPALRAARCSLGCMGVVLEVTLACVPAYRVQETLRRRDTLEQSLEEWERFPLQQLAVMPYSWAYFAFQRGPGAARPGPRRWLNGLAYQLNRLVTFDVELHLVLKLALALPDNAALVRDLFRYVLPRLVLRGWTASGRSEHMLTFQHHLFRHQEMEIFVPEHRAREAFYLSRHLVAHFAGEMEAPPLHVPEVLQTLALDAELAEGHGSYTHHYPLLIRRVLPEDTLISMASGDTPWLSISFFCYLPPARRAGFHRMAELIARVLVGGCEGRLHWGKYFPLSEREIAPGYPQLERFRAECRKVDAAGVFRNAFTERVLGLAPGPLT